eukprot:scaffold162374_cov16-Tisochrysis_lutea.AAC.1
MPPPFAGCRTLFACDLMHYLYYCYEDTTTDKEPSNKAPEITHAQPGRDFGRKTAPLPRSARHDLKGCYFWSYLGTKSIVKKKAQPGCDPRCKESG